MNKKHLLITGALVLISFVFGYKFSSITGKSSGPGYSGNASSPQRPRVAMLPFNIQPTESQRAELDKIDAKYGEKVINARNAMGSIMTPEQRKSRMEAAQKAMKEGKKGKDFMEAMERAAHMTPDQEKKMKEAQNTLMQLSQEMQSEIQKLLTDDQKKTIEERIKMMSQNRPGATTPGGAARPPTPSKTETKTGKTPSAPGKKKS